MIDKPLQFQSYPIFLCIWTIWPTVSPFCHPCSSDEVSDCPPDVNVSFWLLLWEVGGLHVLSICTRGITLGLHLHSSWLLVAIWWVYDGLRLLQVAISGYKWLQVAIGSYTWLQVTTFGDMVGTGSYRWLHAATGDFRCLQVTSAGYRWPQVATRGYMCFQVASGGYRFVTTLQLT